ncbi:TVP38/TMEM64 family protein [Pyxidicoccus fallax]|uniref:TVP38/TMEM64 family membrane protein n=1 Tax=Pyxidicoccus fallax TaxID=394095 RepID=A0A848LI38_9BACT|nr:VTT domain-containing protein [Pyxidicoccus fallax]NMO17268.1 TVP38/TMEM64 family protein [Pyxidicoccus fallax]NPC78977.1 TVP38/TMEM64 family protein [Pyxidicoccus fallax]
MSMRPRAKGLGPGAWLKLLLPVGVSIGLLVSLRVWGPQYLDQAWLSGQLRPLGALAPVAFILLLALRPVTLLPGQLFTAVGGLLFGMVLGTVYVLVGSVLATGLIHLLARRLGRKPMKRLVGANHAAIQRAAREHGFQLGFLACVNSVIPADVLLATAAASGARFRPLALGALVGTVPGTVLTTWFGSSLGQGMPLATAVSATGMVVSMVLGLVLGRRLMRELRISRESDELAETEERQQASRPTRTETPRPV